MSWRMPRVVPRVASVTLASHVVVINSFHPSSSIYVSSSVSLCVFLFHPTFSLALFTPTLRNERGGLWGVGGAEGGKGNQRKTWKRKETFLLASPSFLTWAFEFLRFSNSRYSLWHPSVWTRGQLRYFYWTSAPSLRFISARELMDARCSYNTIYNIYVC